MKNSNFILSVALCALLSLPLGKGGDGLLFAQCFPMIKIDGNQIIADENHTYGIKLPSWLKAGQTLERGNNVFSIAVIEFTVNGIALDYSQNLSITTPAVTVPAGKVWKIESIHKDALVLPPATATYTTAGTYTYVPSCSGVYAVKVWGAGGGGGRGDACTWCWCNAGGAGGGAGGYTEGSFLLSAGTSYTVTVGAGGAGGTAGNGSSGGSSSVSIIGMSATGGTYGTGPQSGCVNIGGAGGTGSGGQINSTGQAGATGNLSTGASGKGGDAPGSGGTGGSSVSATVGPVGNSPGGGGAGGGGSGGNYSGGAGATGQVIISVAGSSSGGSGAAASRDKLQTSQVITADVGSSCYQVPTGKVFRLDGAFNTSGAARYLNFGTSCGGTQLGYIYNSGAVIYWGNTGGTGTQIWPFPLWFKSGDYLRGNSTSVQISGMEFVIE